MISARPSMITSSSPFGVLLRFSETRGLAADVADARRVRQRVDDDVVGRGEEPDRRALRLAGAVHGREPDDGLVLEPGPDVGAFLEHPHRIVGARTPGGEAGRGRPAAAAYHGPHAPARRQHRDRLARRRLRGRPRPGAPPAAAELEAFARGVADVALLERTLPDLRVALRRRYPGAFDLHTHEPAGATVARRRDVPSAASRAEPRPGLTAG